MKKLRLLLPVLLISLPGLASHHWGIGIADTTKPLNQINQSKDSNVLIILDGKIIGNVKSIKSIDEIANPDSIKYVYVWKGKEAIDKYGEKAKDGAIEISTKANAKEVKITEIKTTDTTDNDNITFDKVEVEASFPGGVQAWRSFLERTLNPVVPVDNGAPAGTYTVVIQFVVDRNGNISDIKALTNHGYGMEKEVVRVIQKSPKWLPAMQNERKVRAYRKQPVTFQITEEGGRKRKNKNKD